MNEDAAAQIVNWLKSQIKETSTNGFVLGLSGGLDSAVCAALLRKATENCLGLILPIESDVRDLDDAAAVASAVNIKTHYIDLTMTYKHMITLLPDGDRLALGNIKARLRMVVLYYSANLNNYLVCGTGNKTEISLGYFTKYGDGACDVLPIGDLYKSEVRALARELNLPETVINKVPSAGLWSGQTDEGEIGFTYEQMDEALRQIEKGETRDQTARQLRDIVSKTDHKRRQPKICRLRR
ncbi:NAD+ synthase [candidate division WOR-3 bacterium]|nr:NAD+ synthase [candidate division WOR-3 bacterium]